MTNFDLRGNPGYSEKVNHLLGLCLLSNIDRLKRAYPPVTGIGKNWFNQHIIRSLQGENQNPEEEQPIRVPMARLDVKSPVRKQIPPRPQSGIPRKASDKPPIAAK